jgi:hypothetical protein
MSVGCVLTTDPAHVIAFTFNEFTYKVVSILTKQL